jgi:hypothetical protein
VPPYKFTHCEFRKSSDVSLRESHLAERRGSDLASRNRRYPSLSAKSASRPSQPTGGGRRSFEPSGSLACRMLAAVQPSALAMSSMPVRWIISLVAFLKSIVLPVNESKYRLCTVGRIAKEKPGFAELRGRASAGLDCEVCGAKPAADKTPIALKWFRYINHIFFGFQRPLLIGVDAVGSPIPSDCLSVPNRL